MQSVEMSETDPSLLRPPPGGRGFPTPLSLEAGSFLSGVALELRLSRQERRHSHCAQKAPAAGVWAQVENPHHSLGILKTIFVLSERMVSTWQDWQYLGNLISGVSEETVLSVDRVGDDPPLWAVTIQLTRLPNGRRRQRTDISPSSGAGTLLLPCDTRVFQETL